jgi:hypothetical protein
MTIYFLACGELKRRILHGVIGGSGRLDSGLQTGVPVRFREKMDPYQDAILDQRCVRALRFENEQLA